MSKLIIMMFSSLFLSFCGMRVADECITHRPKNIQGDYYISPVDIDGTWTYLVQERSEIGWGGEAAMQIGVDGKYIYWTTYGTTIYRIDTSEKEQIRIEQIPDGVKMMPIIKCYNTLD
ncbi:MAG: hypothetical protein J1E42_05365 [Akkermansiaceae bacterium]|nr:hypothetical protein [Akkermansiaceae bacterium]